MHCQKPLSEGCDVAKAVPKLTSCFSKQRGFFFSSWLLLCPTNQVEFESLHTCKHSPPKLASLQPPRSPALKRKTKASYLWNGTSALPLRCLMLSVPLRSLRDEEAGGLYWRARVALRHPCRMAWVAPVASPFKEGGLVTCCATPSQGSGKEEESEREGEEAKEWGRRRRRKREGDARQCPEKEKRVGGGIFTLGRSKENFQASLTGPKFLLLLLFVSVTAGNAFQVFIQGREESLIHLLWPWGAKLGFECAAIYLFILYLHIHKQTSYPNHLSTFLSFLTNE